jgi:hypothetical protein
MTSRVDRPSRGPAEQSGRGVGSAGNGWQRQSVHVSRSGRSQPASKYHEGAVAALADVRRALTRAEPGMPGREVAAQVRGCWAAGYETMADPGRDAQAYYTGGLEALERLAHRLRN